jgi:hypothetical protein
MKETLLTRVCPLHYMNIYKCTSMNALEKHLRPNNQRNNFGVSIYGNQEIIHKLARVIT